MSPPPVPQPHGLPDPGTRVRLAAYAAPRFARPGADAAVVREVLEGPLDAPWPLATVVLCLPDGATVAARVWYWRDGRGWQWGGTALSEWSAGSRAA